MYAIIEHNSTACAIIEHYSIETRASSVGDMHDERQWHLLRPGGRENVSEYDQEIPQSHSADQPMVHRTNSHKTSGRQLK